MADAPLVTTISEDKECVVLITTFFTSGPQGQDELIQILINFTEEVMRHQSGFISANIHRSYDGNAITNYVQWHSAEHLNIALQKPEPQEFLKLIREKYRREAALYQVIHISHATDSTTEDPV